MLHSFEAGANAFFYENEPPEDIIFKIRETLKNGCCITKDTINAYRAAQLRTANNTAQAKPLTPREKEVLLYVIQGLKSRQIAAALYIAVKTVNNHRYNIMKKSECHNIVQLLNYAKNKGWI